jgi:lysophospholipase L1-like esterase
MRVRAPLVVVAVLLGLAVIVSLAVAGKLPAARPTAAASGARLLLSLGDSVANGTQPVASLSGSHGYGNVLAAKLGRQLTVLGRGGETTKTMLATGQQAKALAFLRAHRGDDVIVTIAIGANDVEPCAHGTSFPESCTAARVRQVRDDMNLILPQLRAAAGPHVTFVGVTYYDSFLGEYLNGASGRAFASNAAALERRYNAQLISSYGAFHMRVADVEDAFDTDDYRDTERVADYGTLPRAVARICQWTWACSDVAGGNDDHPNSAGYHVIAGAILRALPPALDGTHGATAQAGAARVGSARPLR